MMKRISISLRMIVALSLLTACQSPRTPRGEESIVPENDLCICTKQWIPVCGADGVTYGNACEANCKKVTHTPGECQR